MHKTTFFPLGNADCCRIDLANGKKLLFDFADTRIADDPEDKRIDLRGTLKDDLDEANRSSYDVVAFTHLDDDHICGSSEFFFLDHASKYQGAERVKINILWVPAAVICDEGCTGEAKIIQAEARYRLKRGIGIRVFSRPRVLEDWLKRQGLSIAERQHLFTDAGQLIPGFELDRDGVEFFCHSPFASRLSDGTLLDRNTDSLVVQATFVVEGTKTRMILSSDVDHEALTAIVDTTRYHERGDRLEWDIFKLPHHCSYLSLGPERGKDKTEPVKEVKWLFETQGQWKASIVSTSIPIPDNDDSDQPPHRQARNYYRDVMIKTGGEFLVTMQEPKISSPAPLVFLIDRLKATRQKRVGGTAAAIISTPAPRAG